MRIRIHNTDKKAHFYVPIYVFAQHWNEAFMLLTELLNPEQGTEFGIRLEDAETST